MASCRDRKQEYEKRMNQKRKTVRQTAAWILAVIMISGKLLPAITMLPWKAEAAQKGDTITAYGAGFHHYCIDGAGANRALIDGDEYEYILPSETLSREETALIFWGMLTLQASFGNVPQINAVIRNINAGAAAQGVPAITGFVTEADLKLLIHSSAVRGKYPWLKAVLAREETYLQMAGLLGSGNAALGGDVPAVLQGHTNTGSPALLAPSQSVERPGEYILSFDPSGADSEFIRSVPLKFSATGEEGSFSEQIPGGWICQKTDTDIRLTSTGAGGLLYLMFDVRGTRYGTGGGTFASPEEVYEQCLQIWRCSRCAGTHRQMYNGAAPLAAHQRLVFVEVQAPQLCYYAGVGGSTPAGEDGSMAFEIYRHEEDWTSSYNVRLKKQDHETGAPLESAVFSLYERFDDKDEIHTDRDGAAYIYAGGAPYQSYHRDNPVLWDDFQFVSAMVTDTNGEAEKTIEHGYHYDKTFCDGHPAPVFVPVPEEEEDEETGEIENQAEIDAAKEENRRLATLWLNTCASCETWASGEFSGVHFHWYMPETDPGEIRSIASSGGEEGETPSAGTTVSAEADRAFRDSGCGEDTQETYDHFIALQYSYAIAEDTAREGYTLHGNHRDDLPVEVITTDASENGANAHFAGLYSHEIRISDQFFAEPAQTVREARKQGSSGRLVSETEVPSVRKERRSIWQKIRSIFFPVQTDEELLIDDRSTEAGQEALTEWASMSNAQATMSNAALAKQDYMAVSGQQEEHRKHTATESDAEEEGRSPVPWILRLDFSRGGEKDSGEKTAKSFHGDFKSDMRNRDVGSADLFTDAYQGALHAPGSGQKITAGPADRYSHCSDRDGEDDWWRIYDHRTEGEIHINKRDMDLKSGENDRYDSYGDAQGDAVLEGAVYGLFAEENLVHPDGKTGVVYQKNDLVAVTSTDKNGDASFLACTEAPGRFYNYETGQIENRPGGWNQMAPSNLYARNQSFDDYTEDGQYIRSYPDYRLKNGNCWIGRPLFMGSYYVKELSRSEGYELSVGNRKAPFTNAGQELEASAGTEREGYTVITKGLYAEQQVQSSASGAYGDPAFQELFFQVSSEKSGGFDLVFSEIPEESRLYRLDTQVRTEPAQIGTGRFTESVETDLFGRPVYAVTEFQGQYPRYDADGTLLTRERPVSRSVTDAECAAEKELDTSRCEALMKRPEENLNEDTVLEILRKPFQMEQQNFVKQKLELILRGNGKGTPKLSGTSGTGTRYTTLEHPVYDTGYQSGKEVSFGSPVVTLQIPRVRENGEEVTAGELLASLLDYYQNHAYYSYGGLDGIRELEDAWEVSVYAGRIGNPECFYVSENEKRSAAFYLRVPYVPEETSETPRYCYAVYTGEEEPESFGIYTGFRAGNEAGEGLERVSAVLVPDAQADSDGSLVTRCISETVYYEPGEIPLDANGKRIPKICYMEETVPGETQKLYGNWTEIPINGQAGIWHVESSYTDFYGSLHNDEQGQEYRFKLVLPGPEQVVLTAEEAAMLSGNWVVGDVMGCASYYQAVKQASVRACLDYKDGATGEENSFIKHTVLVYPGQEAVWQDGPGKPGSGTQAVPVAVEERSIRQRIRVSKTIEKTSYRNTSSYADVHEDWWTRQYNGKTAVENFRFKVYLKSNLQNLYRNEQGNVIWQDRKGTERTFEEQKKANDAFPERVNQIYTRVLHRTDPLYKNAEDAIVCNTQLYAYQDGRIQEPGDTALLEMTEALVEDGKTVRTTMRPNYKKFFDAIDTANHDKWDDAAPTYTSWRPVGNAVNRSEDTIWNTRASDRVRQFAITWYLDDVAAKFIQADGNSISGETAFSDEILDRAMREAIEKAQNYLKPFFAYDLDALYAIAWDEAPGGGADGDPATLSVDVPDPSDEEISEYYGISAMLPYGTYVVVEQQPKDAGLKDFKNRHYETDQPKEIELPAVYADEAGAQASPGILDPFYRYQASFKASELERRYQIRFLEESRVLQAHGSRGDFEIYPYGLEIDRFRNGEPETLAAGDFASLTQSAYRPFQNYYNEADDRTAVAVSYYLSEGQDGRKAVSEVYRYSSVSEQACTADNVSYPGGEMTEDNIPGAWYRDRVPAMQGSQTAYDGRYAPMLVPHSVVMDAENTSEASGYGNVRFRNRLYTARLRLEKLDSETHENILHDGAVFRIYAAKRDDGSDGEGRVLFYEEDTQICGSKEFLTAMGAADIRPVLRDGGIWNWLAGFWSVGAGRMDETESVAAAVNGAEACYTGVVPAGTPVCDESEQILLGDRFGLQTGVMKAFATVWDGQPADASEHQLQTVGYLYTPQPLSAGTYVLCETKAPAGYARSKPVALEIYSDQITYYQNGERDSRVISAIYEDAADEQTTYGTKPQDLIDTARVYLKNEPIRLQVEKRAMQTEAGETFLERDAGEKDASEYASGALMTLFDAISITPSGDSQDFAYEGLVICRDDAGHVERMYVKEGYGGAKTEFLPEQDENGRLYTVSWPAGVDRYGEIIQADGNVWDSVTVMRPDTDILYYDLSDLSVQITPQTDGKDGRYQAFAWKGASKFLEFEGGDLTKITYDEKDKILTLDKGTHVYHLGRDGARDALVDPYTGMAYVVRDFDGSNGSWDQICGRDGTGAGKKQVMVWPVNIRRDEYGNVIARDKITTSRMAIVGSGETAYLTGSWKSDSGEESHRKSSLSRNMYGQNLNDEILLDANNGSFEKTMNPVYDRHGLTDYYQKSEERYDKATELYDRNGEFVRSQLSDNLEADNHDAYAVQEHSMLIDEEQTLFHRKGEAYVVENTWISSEQYPNDPFTSVKTGGQGDILERVPAGCYIMEELRAPEGFVKALPMGISVEETAETQTITMIDEPVRTEFTKISGGNSAFDCGYVENALLGLWKAEAENGKGMETSDPVMVWTTDGTPHCITHLPVGTYIWKEIQVPSGFVSHDSVLVSVKECSEIQQYEMKEDHTKIEVEKYCLENGKDRADGEMAVGGAGFTLYPAKLDDTGSVCYEEGRPLYEESLPVAHWITDDGTTCQAFPDAFETMYLEHGAKPGSSVMWDAGDVLYRAEFMAEYQKEQIHPADPKQTVLVYRMETGAVIRIGVTKETDLQADHPYRFEYQFNWQELSNVNAYACSYLTVENRQRLDYLPAGSSYVLVETEVPAGFVRAQDMLITVTDTGEIQLYRVENEEGSLLISKVYENGTKELAGARLALYRADETGGLTRNSRYLFDSWVSGSDGRYTELDAINRRIPQGYAEGDLKPHRIRHLPDGIYWLAEQQSPAYYTTFEPVQILYEWQPEIRIVRVNDRPVTGTLKLEKTDSSGRPLEGAVFELEAYTQAAGIREDTAEPVFRMCFSAPAEQTGLPVGEVMQNGRIQPYWYELRETEPPAGYALNPEVKRWQFEPDMGAGSYAWREQAKHQVTVVDRKEPDTPKPEPEKPETPNPDKPRPEEPDKPEEKPGKPGGPEHENPRTPELQPVLRIGRILAWYRPSSPDGAAWLYLGPDGRWRIRLPAMGDERKTLVWCALFVMSTAFLGALCGRKKTTEGKNTENRTK